MNGKSKRIFWTIAIIIAIGILVYAGVVVFNNSSNKGEPIIFVPQSEMLNTTLDNTLEEASKSSGMWELMCKLFPDQVIYKDKQGRFTHEEVDRSKALNTYDWSDLSGTYRGMDVSYYQGNIDWTKVKNSKINYAIIRVGYRGYTKGSFSDDKYYKQNIEGALANDIPVGVYMVTKAITPEEGREEALYILDRIKPYNITWPVVIDIEPTTNLNDRTATLTAEERTAIVLEFCNTVREAGYTPMIYGSIGTFMSYLEFDKLEGIEKWFAMYFNQPYLRYEFGIWQASDSGQVSGIKGDVDINYSIKDYANLLKEEKEEKKAEQQ